MNNKNIFKYLIIIAIVVLVIVATVLIILNTKVKNPNIQEDVGEEDLPELEIDESIEKIDQINTFSMVEKIVNSNIDSNTTFFATEIYFQEIDVVLAYRLYVFGEIFDIGNQSYQNVFFAIDFDEESSNYKITQKKLDIEQSEYEQIAKSGAQKYLITDNYNGEFLQEDISDNLVVKRYFDYYKMLMITNPEKAYSLLDDEYKKIKFENYNNFYTYINNKIAQIKAMELFGLNIHFPVTDPTWIFFLVLIIILFAPMILGRLRIPHIIGMILAGVLVGKYGFNILERDSSFELFGKVGLYYIMFLAGLEMDMDDFKKNKTKGLVFGLFTFLIPMALGIWSSMSLLDYGLVTSILLASMYASHTLIAYPIISRYGLSRQRTVSITIGGTAVTVVLALMVLAVIGGMYKGEDVGGLFWAILLGKVLALFGLIIFLMPRISRWFFRTYEDAVMQFVFVLAMVFLGGGLMELVGMEGILGAFLAGLVLNRFVPHVSPLMNRLEFVGNALFIPYFLIGVGMIIDVRCLFTQGEALKVAVVMTVVATFSKWLAAWITQKIYGMQKVERSLIFGLSNAQAAATLAAVLIGHEIIMENGERLLNDDVLNGTVVMILFTCIISSVATERAARRMVTQENLTGNDDKNNKEQERILIPVANPDTIEGLVGMALMMRHPKQKEPLVALSVINDNNASETKELIGKRNLERTAMVAAAADASVKTVLRYDLNIAQGIIHTLKEYAVTDVVIGLHRKTNLMDSFFGTMTENLLKGTHRQIMIAKLLMPVNTLRRIVVAVPEKAEYEVGFMKWVVQLCRMGKLLGCRVHFFATEDTLRHLRAVVEKQEANTFTEFSVLEEWDDLLLLTGQVNFDHLFVVVSARKGSISYQTSFERLPSQVSKYFADASLLIIYPDQLGDPQEIVSFSDPRGQSETRMYDNVGKWFYKWFKKGDERN